MKYELKKNYCKMLMKNKKIMCYSLTYCYLTIRGFHIGTRSINVFSVTRLLISAICFEGIHVSK